jgi:ribosomal protein L11 methyltransferase
MVVLCVPGSIDDETLTTALWDAGCLGLAEQPERPGEVLAYFDAPFALAGVLEAGSWEAPDDTDYVAKYNQDVQPVRIGNLIIAPEHAKLTPEESQNAIIIRLDPGRAFGSGQHLTTQLALEAIAQHAAQDSPEQRRLLDVGAGSGILTIAADLLGYQAEGIDIDPETIAVAEANARANASQATFTHTSLDTLPAAHYDIVVANIYANVHAALAADYARALIPGGTLLLTGIYLEDGLQTTLTGIAPWFEVGNITRSDTWSLVSATKGK